MNKGLFIDFEGGEFVGKTTQIRRAKAYLESKGFNVITTHEPGGGDPQIREKLLDAKGKLSPEEELDLFCEDRQFHVENIIRPALDEGKIVLCDRFEPSTIAYQGYGRGLSRELIKQKSARARWDIWPDCIILLDADPVTAFSRAEAVTRFEQEDFDFHNRVREGFLAQVKEDPKHGCLIDATPSEEKVWQKVKECLDRLISEYVFSPSNA